MSPAAVSKPLRSAFPLPGTVSTMIFALQICAPKSCLTPRASVQYQVAANRAGWHYFFLSRCYAEGCVQGADRKHFGAQHSSALSDSAAFVSYLGRHRWFRPAMCREVGGLAKVGAIVAGVTGHHCRF
jgi:hypothetical protein